MRVGDKVRLRRDWINAPKNCIDQASAYWCEELSPSLVYTIIGFSLHGSLRFAGEYLAHNPNCFEKAVTL